VERSLVAGSPSAGPESIAQSEQQTGRLMEIAPSGRVVDK